MENHQLHYQQYLEDGIPPEIIRRIHGLTDNVDHFTFSENRTQIKAYNKVNKMRVKLFL